MSGSKTPRKRATINEVARMAGVSIKTVSRVVNGVPSVNADMAARVRIAVDELRYRPDHLASTLKAGSRTATVGLIGKDIASEYAVEIRRGAETVVARHASRLIAVSTPESDSSGGDLALASELANRRFDGLLIVPTAGDYSLLSVERDHGLPIVFLERDAHGIDADTVVIDDFGGARRVVKQLFAQGHERIALLLSTMTDGTMPLRLQGAKAALREEGLLVSQAVTITGIASSSDAATVIGRLLDSANPPTAVFCASPHITVGAIKEIYRRDTATAIAGFGGFSLASLMPVPLTLAEFDAYELGRAATELLYRRLEHPDLAFERVVLPVTFREYDGTAQSR